MSEMSSLMRHWTMLRLLSSKRLGCTLQELAAELGVSQKTVRRDIDTLRQIGLPLEETTGEHGRKYWKVSESAWHPPLTVTLTELASLSLARRFLEPLAGTLFWEGTHSFFAKIRSMLSEPAQRYLEKLSLALHQTTPGVSNYAHKAEVIDSLMIAVEDRRIASICYQSLSATEPVTHELHPYGLVFHLGSLYLIANSVLHNEIRHFKIDRVINVDLLDLRFQKPVDFRLQDHLADSFGIFKGDGPETRVRVRFSPQAKRYVEEKVWHPSQVLKPQRDGTLIAEFQLSGTDEIRKWIMSFGKNAEVLEPVTMRQKIRDDLRYLLSQYERPAPDSKKSG